MGVVRQITMELSGEAEYLTGQEIKHILDAALELGRQAGLPKSEIAAAAALVLGAAARVTGPDLANPAERPLTIAGPNGAYDLSLRS